MSKKQQLILGYLIFLISIIVITIIKEPYQLKKENTKNMFKGNWKNIENNSYANVEILNDFDYLIKYKNKNNNCYYNFNRNIYNLNFDIHNFDLIYLNVLESSCGNDYKNQKLVFKIDKNNINKVKLKYVNTEELNQLVSKLNTTKEIEQNIKNLLSLFNAQTKYNNYYNNFELNFIKERN